MSRSNRDAQTSLQDVALIVGGGPGISSSCARLFSANGMRVAVAARNPDKPVLSRGVRKKARSLGVRFSFLFMRAQGQQLIEITSLIESGVIRPVVDKIFPFEKTGEALAYVETGRAKGKVVIALKQ